jgi:hypothetical protein
MDRDFRLQVFARGAACVLLLGVSASWTAAAERASGAELAIAVFDQHYVLAGRRFDDLDRLEEALAQRRPGAIRLNRCGPATTRALMAAMHRFRDLRLHVRTLQPAEPACSSTASVAARAVAGPWPAGIDDAAVARYWQELAP